MKRDNILSEIKPYVYGWIEDVLRASPSTGSNLIASSGAVPTFDPIAIVSVYRSAAYTHSTDEIVFDTELADEWNGWSIANPSRINLPGGLYFVTSSAGFTGGGTASLQLALRGANVGTTLATLAIAEGATTTGQISHSISTLLRVTTPNAYVESVAFVGATSTPLWSVGRELNLIAARLGD